MTETDVNPDLLVGRIHDAGRPVAINALTRHALRAWLEARVEVGHHARGVLSWPHGTVCRG